MLKLSYICNMLIIRLTEIKINNKCNLYATINKNFKFEEKYLNEYIYVG